MSTTHKEINLRIKEFELYGKGKGFSFRMPHDSLWAYKVFPVDIMNLELLHFAKYDIKLNRIDSVLRAKKFIQGDFVLNRVYSKDGKVIESTAPEMTGKLDSALKVKEIPLRFDESEVLQLYLLNPEKTIFYKMFSIILLSLAVVLIVFLMLGWQYSLFNKEKEMRQFQKDHTEAIVHNMTSPLQTIQIVNKTFLENVITDQEKREKLLNVQERQISHLQNQVEQILTVSRANSSGIELHSKDVDIKDLISNVCTPLQNHRSKKIEIHTNFDLIKPTAVLDAKLFSDALRNLVENSIKYSKDSVRIEISSVLTATELKITVQDNGLGIAKKHQKDIFEKFNRGNAHFSGKNRIKGFGIGLSFVKAVVNAHKGITTMHSEGENKGCRFVICIPQ
ncbi:MAG: HAMP domain-containing histidine kinase [Flavobacteriaceae bacterium]|nr:HAMP domain-containing histidine kinase [Flavobacteriaceae bacterium]